MVANPTCVARSMDIGICQSPLLFFYGNLYFLQLSLLPLCPTTQCPPMSEAFLHIRPVRWNFAPSPIVVAPSVPDYAMPTSEQRVCLHTPCYLHEHCALALDP